ncbi:MAG: type II toxin-antitoxin system Phd/YefM family antitoxin [Myxococcota bacterium]
MRLSHDVLSLTDFRDHLTARIDQVQKEGRPLVVTRNGRAAAVVLSAEAYDRLRYESYVRAKAAAGLADLAAGRTASHAQVLHRARAKLERR